MEENEFLKDNNKKKKAIGLIHKIYLIQLKNAKSYTSSTKTKSEVRGGGKKPWRQKGTGQARAGSTRSPLWVGGGVIFGPKPKQVSKKSNKKERRLAILSGLYLKKNCIQPIDDKIFEEKEIQKTKEFIQILKTLEVSLNSKILIILPKIEKKLWLASRNCKNVEIVTANCLSLKHLLDSTKILVSTQSLDIIKKTYGKSYI